MFFRRISIIAAAALLFCTVAGVGIAHAQGGRSVSDFSLKNSANADVALKSYAGSKAVVVVFLNPSCAYSKLYQNRLSALNSQYSGRGVQFLFINAPINLEASTDLGEAEKLKIKATADLPLLTDEGQKVSSLLGATKTPEVVLLQPAGDGFAVRYKGAIDDNPLVEGDVKEHYVQQALDNLLAGHAVGIADKRGAGCLIKR